MGDITGPYGKNQAILEEIGIDRLCEEYVNELSTIELAKKYGIERWSLRHFVEKDENAEKWERARKAKAARYAEECLEIADDETGDMYMDAKGERPNSVKVKRDSLRIEQRRWFAAVLDPDTFADKAAANVNINIQNVHLDVLRSMRGPVIEGKVERGDG